MAADFTTALANVETAAGILFDADASIRSVGVGTSTDGVSYVAVRNASAVVPLSGIAGTPSKPLPPYIEGVAVHVVNSFRDPISLIRVPHSGPGSPGVSSLVPEQQYHRPIVCGLQIQNYDHDVRTGELARGVMIVGTLGCFVKLGDGSIAILSNNHVVAGENNARIADAILQQGGPTMNAALGAASLTDFVRLRPSPAGASIIAGNVILNEVDGGVAALSSQVQHLQSFLPTRSAAVAPKGTATASVGDKVHKVGRTTGLTFGTVTQVGVVVGPVAYTPGPCWFRQCIIIEGENGATFSDHGDSGSSIVRDDGMVVGLLFAGNGTQTFACDIGQVLAQLNCNLT
jgi:hypothetical protein